MNNRITFYLPKSKRQEKYCWCCSFAVRIHVFWCALVALSVFVTCLPIPVTLSCVSTSTSFMKTPSFLSFNFPLDLKYSMCSISFIFTPHSQLVLPSHSSFIFIFFISSSSFFVLPQCILVEMSSREQELCRLKERAHCLWEGQAAGKGFVHRVSQLSAQYLALSNLTKVILRPPCCPLPAFLSTYLCFCLRNLAACWNMSCLIHVLLQVKTKYSVLFLLFLAVIR